MVPQIKKLLYATDLSKNSSYAFYHAINMARTFDAKIVILHAIEPIPPYVEVYVAGMAERIEDRDRRMTIDHVQKLLQEFCEKMETQTGGPCLSLISKVSVLVGHPVEEILRVAEQEDCDLILLGSHGKGFLTQTFLGSVSRGVLHRSRKPVYVVPLPVSKGSVDWDEI